MKCFTVVTIDKSLHRLSQASEISLGTQNLRSAQTTQPSVELSKICQVFPDILPLFLGSVRQLAENVWEHAPVPWVYIKNL